MISPLDEAKSIGDILQLFWMDGAKLSGGSYANEPSINAEEAKSALKALIVEAVIGEDDPMKDGEDTNQLIAAENQRLRKRNKLRSEQRNTLDDLFNGKE